MTADLSNWREAPHNIWAFHNVDKVAKVHLIEKDISKSTTLEQDFRSFYDFKLQIGESQALDLAKFLKFTNTDGLIVLHNGKIVYEFYDHGNDESSMHILMTKSVTGLVTGILANQGKIDVNAPIKDYVPEASAVYDKITVQNCLDMTTGLVYDDNNHEYRAASGWTPARGDEPADNLHDFISKLEASTVDPGTVFNYNSVNTDLLGWALERASGKKLADLISELLWKPMGAEHEAIITVDKNGNARAAGGLCATVRDLARVGQVIADGGRGIVPKEWVYDMLYNGDKTAFSRSAWANNFQRESASTAYRDCWISNGDNGSLIGLGVYGQMLVVDTKHNMVMAKTSSQPNRFDSEPMLLALLAFEEFRRLLESS
ncbi:hypothetical protein M433DRAFT_8443 [Acidomyces richmondensis BFW]|nr:hypothetical protein M433DRAFT_8443 [Acidomyces richmondensis BFW]